jgi:hypothetical protein
MLIVRENVAIANSLSSVLFDFNLARIRVLLIPELSGRANQPGKPIAGA